jgi:hypothetical protein
MRKPVAENEVRLLDNLLADELHGILSRMRLRDVSVDSLHLRIILLPEDRHVREHRQGVERRRCRLRRKNVDIPDAHPRLFGERRVEIRVDALDYAASCAAQTRISLVSRVSKGRRCRFAQQESPTPHGVVVLCLRPQVI